MDNLIINVGRQVGSGGHDIAQNLAKRFNCKFYDKELLNLAARESGFSEKFFEQNDEHRGFLYNITHFRLHFMESNNYYSNSFSQDSLYKFQSDAILKAADEIACVFVGRTADYVLRNYKKVVNIFITANMDQRIQRVCKRKNLSRAEARKFIKKEESERATYYNYYTGKRWGHSESYDLCVNSSDLGIEGTEQFVADFISRRFHL